MSRFLKGYVFSPMQLLDLTVSELESVLKNTKSIALATGKEHAALTKQMQEQACYIQRELFLRLNSKNK